MLVKVFQGTGFDAIDHFRQRHDFLAWTMSAAFLANLIFHMHGSNAGADTGFDRARNIECTAPAGVDIDQQRHIGSFNDTARIDQNIFHRADAEIRHAQ